jgi:hypothetical protein
MNGEVLQQNRIGSDDIRTQLETFSQNQDIEENKLEMEGKSSKDGWNPLS